MKTLTTSLTLGLAALLCSRVPDAAPTNGTVSGTVKFVRNGNPIAIADGYVYLIPVRRGRRVPPKPVTAAIVQKDKKFTPRRLVIPVGSTVAFPNEEKASSGNEHNVFSPTTPSFDLQRYAPGKSKSRQFLDEGEYDIYCDIHVGMTAKIKVVESDHIARVVDNRFTLTGVPAGKYKVVGWAPDSPESKESIEVTVGATTTVPQINVQLGKSKNEHLRKDGSPYCSPTDKYNCKR